MTKKRIHFFYKIALSVSLGLAGICLCAACVHIYRSGAQPFSPEAVGTAFRAIAVPVYLCLALIAGGFILDIAAPYEAQKSKTVQYRMLLETLQRKLDPETCDPALLQSILSVQKTRKLRKWITLALLAAGSAVFLCYALNPANLPPWNMENPSVVNNAIIQAVLVMLPCLAIPFSYGIFAAYADLRNIRKEIELTKRAIAGGSKKTSSGVQPEGKLLLYVKLALLCIGAAVLIYGFCTGGAAAVLTKAAKLCTECVGLG